MRLHWLFVLLLVLAALAGRYMEALILLGSLAAHEIAHLMVAWVLELEVQDVVLTPFGGMARIDAALESDPQAETSVALAGPFQSFFLAGLALFLTGEGIWDQYLLRFFFEVNANLAFFNLIPALPLDGGRALRGLLAQRWGYRNVTRWMASAGRICGLLMTGVALLIFLRTRQLYSAPLIAGLFIGWGAGREMESTTYRSYRQFLNKRKRMARRRVMATGQLVVAEETSLQEVLHHLSERRYHLVMVVDSHLRPLGVLHEAELMDAFQEWGPTIRLGQILDR